MNVYNEINYREVIKKSVVFRRRFIPKFSFQKLSEQTKIQKTYLSKVVHGSADLNSDQLYLVCQALEFDPAQCEYVSLLLDYERSNVKERKQQLLRRIRKIQNQHLETKAVLRAKTVETEFQNLAEYYLDPFHQIVHVSLLIERYRVDPSLLASDLKITEKRLQQILRKLEVWGVIRRTEKGIEVLMNNIHLPRESAVYSAWRNQVRHLSVHQLHQSQNSDDYSFTAVFSSDIATRKKIHAKLLEVVRDAESLVKVSDARATFQLNLDLVRWTTD